MKATSLNLISLSLSPPPLSWVASALVCASCSDDRDRSRERVVLATKVKMTTTMKMMTKMPCLVLAVLLVLAAVVEIRAQEDPLQVSSEVVSPATATSEVQNFEAPWFYHGLEGPEFVEVSKANNYVVREYPESYWSATTVLGKNLDDAGSEAFMRLFRYISGANAEGQKIEMTAPVLASVIPGDGPFCEENFTYHFYLPREFQTNPPEPTEETVTNVKLPPLSVAVAEYGGWSNEREVISKGRALFETLREDNVPFNSEMFYTAGYDSPFRLIDRHNEIWVALEDASASTDA
jgi:hypothetical protein